MCDSYKLVCAVMSSSLPSSITEFSSALQPSPTDVGWFFFLSADFTVFSAIFTSGNEVFHSTRLLGFCFQNRFLGPILAIFFAFSCSDANVKGLGLARLSRYEIPSVFFFLFF